MVWFLWVQIGPPGLGGMPYDFRELHRGPALPDPTLHHPHHPESRITPLPAHRRQGLVFEMRRAASTVAVHPHASTQVLLDRTMSAGNAVRCCFSDPPPPIGAGGARGVLGGVLEQKRDVYAWCRSLTCPKRPSRPSTPPIAGWRLRPRRPGPRRSGPLFGR